MWRLSASTGWRATLQYACPLTWCTCSRMALFCTPRAAGLWLQCLMVSSYPVPWVGALSMLNVMESSLPPTSACSSPRALQNGSARWQRYFFPTAGISSAPDHLCRSLADSQSTSSGCAGGTRALPPGWMISVCGMPTSSATTHCRKPTFLLSTTTTTVDTPPPSKPPHTTSPAKALLRQHKPHPVPGYCLSLPSVPCPCLQLGHALLQPLPTAGGCPPMCTLLHCNIGSLQRLEIKFHVIQLRVHRGSKRKHMYRDSTSRMHRMPHGTTNGMDVSPSGVCLGDTFHQPSLKAPPQSHGDPPRTADKWLCIHSHVRWRHLATSSEPAPPPAPALLDTTSSHDLQLPRHQLHGPQQALKKTSTNTHLPTDLHSTHPSWADALRSTTLLCQPYLSTVGTSK